MGNAQRIIMMSVVRFLYREFLQATVRSLIPSREVFSLMAQRSAKSLMPTRETKLL